MVPTSLFTSITDTTTVRSSSASAERVEVDDAVETGGDPRDPEAIALQTVARSEDGLVLERSRDDAVTAARGSRAARAAALHRQVVGLAATGREDDLAGTRTEGCRHRLPSLFEGGLRRAGRSACPPDGLPNVRRQEGRHRRHRLGAHGRGRGEIEVARWKRVTKLPSLERDVCHIADRGISVTPLGDTPLVTTQLRLVEAPGKPRTHAAAVKRASTAKGAQARKPRTTGKATTARRPVHWGDWQLDARTRRVGRAGVAAARRALNEARAAQQLSEAS